MAASMNLLARAAEGLPIGTAYAVWTGIGAVGTATVGMFLLNEPREWRHLACIVLIILGVVVVVLAIGAFVWWFLTRNQVSTDDAYTDGDAVTIAPRTTMRAVSDPGEPVAAVIARHGT